MFLELTIPVNQYEASSVKSFNDHFLPYLKCLLIINPSLNPLGYR